MRGHHLCIAAAMLMQKMVDLRPIHSGSHRDSLQLLFRASAESISAAAAAGC